MRSFQTETPEINRAKWKLECHETSPGKTKLIVREPRIVPKFGDGKPNDGGATESLPESDTAAGLRADGDLDTVQLKTTSTPAGVAEDVLTLSAGGPAVPNVAVAEEDAISVAETDRRALNLFEFGLNRALCQDPMNSEAPIQTESNIQAPESVLCTFPRLFQLQNFLLP